MNRLIQVLDRFWFEPAPAARLAILRILMGAFAFYFVAIHYEDWVAIGSETKASLFEPVGVVGILKQPLPGEVNEGLLIATLAFNVLFVLGWRHRITGPVFGALLMWTLSYRNSWSMIYHSAHLVALHVLILGLTPSADALSLDARRAARRAGAPPPEDSVGDWRYGWPIKLICAVTLLTYCLAGVAKVAGPAGWEWAKGECLRDQVAADALRKEVLGKSHGFETPLAATSQAFYVLYEQLWLFTILAVGSLILELGAPLALLDRRLGYLFAIAAFLMHWGIMVIMGITFRYHLSGIVFASFFPMERALAWLRLRLAWRKPEPNPTT